MARRLSVVASVVAVILLAGCGSDPKPATAPGLDTRTVNIDELEIIVTPTRVNAGGAAFDIAFDTHTGAPDIDVAANTTLDVDGTAWTNPTWTSDGTSGHHRAGTLTFAAAGPAAGTARLEINGLDAPAEVTWRLP